MLSGRYEEAQDRVFREINNFQCSNEPVVWAPGMAGKKNPAEAGVWLIISSGHIY